MKPIKLLLLCGGQSAEHEISLISAWNVVNSLDDRFEITLIAIDKQGNWFLQNQEQFLQQEPNAQSISIVNKKEQIALVMGDSSQSFLNLKTNEYLPSFDVVFPILHGPNGEDGSIQGVLKHCQIAYIGSDVIGSAICMDKAIAKQLMMQNDIPTSKFIELKQTDSISFEEAKEKLGLPLFVKPANMGSSVGIKKVNKEQEFQAALNHAFSYDSKTLIEEFIEGTEVEVAILGNEDLITSEPGCYVHQDDFFDFDTKYLKNNEVSMQIPAAFLSEKQREELKELSKKAYQALQCKGIARVDTFVTPSGQYFVNEINTLPGFTQNSMYSLLLKEKGIEFNDLVERMCLLAVESNH